MSSGIKDAIILAGGRGERLRPHTNNRPKPMVEVGGKPIFEYQLEQLIKAGVKRVVFAVSYKKEVLMDYVGDGSRYAIQVLYSIEEEPLGRGGGIKQAMGMLGSLGDLGEKIIVTNGDNLWKLDVNGLVEKSNDSLATIVVVPLRSPYGVVDSNEQDQITGFKEKPILPYWINAGIYIFNKKIKDLLPDVGDHETETFPSLPREKFLVFKSEDYWRGVDTAKDLTDAEKELALLR